MDLHFYQSSSGKNLIFDYIDSLPIDEQPDGYTVLKYLKEGKMDCIQFKGDIMPFIKVDINNIIDTKIVSDSKFKKAWDESQEEYRLIGEMISIRKSEKISQGVLAEKTGTKQQVISRIEKRENSPSLKTFCNLLHALGYELRIVKQDS